MDADLGRGESPNVNTRRVVAILAGVLIFVAAVSFGLQALFRDRIGQTYTVQHAFPAPAVIPGERQQRLALEAKQRRELRGAHGRMPIDAAMKAIAAKGSRAFDPVGGPQ
jgi:acyl-CoA thioesterase